jgi:hypothetical protein
MGLIDEKTEGRKSRATVPLKQTHKNATTLPKTSIPFFFRVAIEKKPLLFMLVKVFPFQR